MSDLEKSRQTINEIDQEMARLFEQRMDAVRRVAEFKSEHGLSVEDLTREAEILRNNYALIANEAYRPYYLRFLQSIMDNSKDFQRDFIMDTMYVKSSGGGYPIHFGRGLIQRTCDVFNLNRKVLIVTDTGVPEQYSMTVASQCDEALLFMFEQGEASKNMDTFFGLLQTLTENHFTRTDCIVAVGGGVVGDIAGFAAATYMRGIDFYNIPTTLLSQVDSSIGGKTAIDFMGYKNLVGSFYPPIGVLIDPSVLGTLPERQVSNGLAEAVKMALTHDTQLFALLENGILSEDVMDEIIYRSISIKKHIVEQDEHESHLRKVLNFGHTLGHGIEAVTDLYHGECVALGMLPMCTEEVRKRLFGVMERLNLPTSVVCNVNEVIEACRHDKKTNTDTITLVTVPHIGHYELKSVKFQEFETLVQEVLGL